MTDPHDYAALVERAREISSCMTGDYDGEFDNWALWIGRMADAIEALTARVAELEEVKAILTEASDAARDVWLHSKDTPTQCGYLMNAHLVAGHDLAHAALGDKQ